MTFQFLLRTTLFTFAISSLTGCTLNYQNLYKKKWALEEHDSLVKDSLILNKINFSFKHQNFKTLQFERNQKFSYNYQNFPFYNRSPYMVCGTNELELNQESTFYENTSDTLRLKFEGSELSTPDCCKYDVDKEFKVLIVDNKTVKLFLIEDLKK